MLHRITHLLTSIIWGNKVRKRCTNFGFTSLPGNITHAPLPHLPR